MADTVTPKCSGRVSAATKRKHEGDEVDGPTAAPKDVSPKRPKTIGPAMPPPNMRPQADDSSENGDSDSDDDDDYGPTLPPANGPSAPQGKDTTKPTSSTYDNDDTTRKDTSTTAKPTQRDDWMLRPPDELDLTSRLDPTKLRNRKFNTAPGRPSGPAGLNNMWTETPEQKRKRLQDEVMGVKAPATASQLPKQQPSEMEVAMSKQVQEYNEKKRNKSLYVQHQGKAEDLEQDDPSARPFDKEKDIRAPSKITHAQRRELLNRASNFSSRFSGGNFL